MPPTSGVEARRSNGEGQSRLSTQTAKSFFSESDDSSGSDTPRSHSSGSDEHDIFAASKNPRSLQPQSARTTEAPTGSTSTPRSISEVSTREEIDAAKTNPAQQAPVPTALVRRNSSSVSAASRRPAEVRRPSAPVPKSTALAPLTAGRPRAGRRWSRAFFLTRANKTTPDVSSAVPKAAGGGEVLTGKKWVSQAARSRVNSLKLPTPTAPVSKANPRGSTPAALPAPEKLAQQSPVEQLLLQQEAAPRPRDPAPVAEEKEGAKSDAPRTIELEAENDSLKEENRRLLLRSKQLLQQVEDKQVEIEEAEERWARWQQKDGLSSIWRREEEEEQHRERRQMECEDVKSWLQGRREEDRAHMQEQMSSQLEKAKKVLSTNCTELTQCTQLLAAENTRLEEEAQRMAAELKQQEQEVAVLLAAERARVEVQTSQARQLEECRQVQTSQARQLEECRQAAELQERQRCEAVALEEELAAARLEVQRLRDLEIQSERSLAMRCPKVEEGPRDTEAAPLGAFTVSTAATTFSDCGAGTFIVEQAMRSSGPLVYGRYTTAELPHSEITEMATADEEKQPTWPGPPLGEYLRQWQADWAWLLDTSSSPLRTLTATESSYLASPIVAVKDSSSSLQSPFLAFKGSGCGFADAACSDFSPVVGGNRASSCFAVRGQRWPSQ